MIYYCKQRSEEWFNLRLGHLTGSRADDALAKTKDISTESERRAGLRFELMAERLSGLPVEHDVTWAMRNGQNSEPLAMCEYQLRTGYIITPVGFARHPKIQWFGASPDGLINEDGLLEVKCPLIKTHTKTLTTKTIPRNYLNQIFSELACTGREWCDYVSYCPEMRPELQIYIQRVHRDDGLIRGLETEVICFLESVEAAISQLEKEYGVDKARQWLPDAASGRASGNSRSGKAGAEAHQQMGPGTGAALLYF
jgi:putative phage-type endonuclease